MAASPSLRRLGLWASGPTRLRSRMAALSLCLFILLTCPLVQLYGVSEAKFYIRYWPVHSLQVAKAGHPQSTINSPCQDFPSTEGIVVSLKTRAGNAYSRLPPHFLTHLQCLPDVLVFSDMEQDIAGHRAHDVLDRVEDHVKIQNKGFRFYQDQMDCSGPQEQCQDDPIMAAELEKYMTINSVTRAWELRPGRDWYVFIEDDTYVIWPSLILWLREKAHRDRDPFVGSAVMLNGYAFAHGSSGFAISGRLIDRWMKKFPNVAKTYDTLAHDISYGGLALAKALELANVGVKQAHPMFNGESPTTAPFGHNHWCQPVFTMATMTSQKISDLWEYEKSRNDSVCCKSNTAWHSEEANHFIRASFNTDISITNFSNHTWPTTAKTGTIYPVAPATSVPMTKNESPIGLKASKSQNQRKTLLKSTPTDQQQLAPKSARQMAWTLLTLTSRHF
ncbi:hypothetical protein J3458_005615 [Metarhizium acridum]|uniref:uncharacterized protein n=1 Tax=Metarhizium acridum TaxID=92637 RepID=UPI001C6BF03B|nr:hypothetical protein J3458_005615 [Metarhizium acridum]